MYWPAIYAFLRRSGCEREHAKDLTQGFFAHLLEVNLLQKANPERGRFRSFLLGSLRFFVSNEEAKARALKRGGGFEITSLGDSDARTVADDGELVRISSGLDRLASVDASLAEVVDLKFFCGFSFAEIAALRGVSERTVQRRWEKARIYLHREIRPAART